MLMKTRCIRRSIFCKILPLPFFMGMRVIALLICLAWGTTVCAAENDFKIRAGFWGLKPVAQERQHLALLRANGFNTALIMDNDYDIRASIWQTLAPFARENHVDLFPTLNFAGPREIERLAQTFRAYVGLDGVPRPATPCPTAETYWHQVVGDRFAQFARLAQDSPFTGAVIDTEMYAAEVSIYREPCLCDVCWRAFRDVHPDVPDVPAAERLAYLTQHDLRPQYEARLTERVEALLRPIEQRIHAIRPEFQLGILAYVPNWFYKGLIQGLGTEAQPVLVFSETTYTQGYTAYVAQERHAVQIATQGFGQQPRARYVPGVWLGRFFPASLPAQLYALATETDGYWIFTADSLWTPEAKPEPYALRASTQAYWESLRHANDAIQRAPRGHAPTIAPVYLASFYDVAQQRLLTSPARLTFFQQLRDLPGQTDVPQAITTPIFRGKTLMHCFHDPQRARTALEVAQPSPTLHLTRMSVGANTSPLDYQLFESDGQIFRAGELAAADESLAIKIPPHLSGLLALLIDPKGSAIQVTFAGMACALEASPTFPLILSQTPQTYTFFARPEQSPVVFSTYCAEQSHGALEFHAPDQPQPTTFTVQGFTEGLLPNGETSALNDVSTAFQTLSLRFQEGAAHLLPPAQTQPALSEQKRWTLTLHPPAPDSLDSLEFYLQNEQFPYLLFTPNES